MKAYTSIKQSKRLAEILPIESADMWYGNEDHYKIAVGKWKDNEHDEDDVPCWSLAALLEIIKEPTAFTLLIDGRGCRCHCRDKHEGKFYGTDDYCDNPVDACVEIIIKLHKQKLL